jgi:hypothetical protein
MNHAWKNPRDIWIRGNVSILFLTRPKIRQIISRPLVLPLFFQCVPVTCSQKALSTEKVPESRLEVPARFQKVPVLGAD